VAAVRYSSPLDRLSGGDEARFGGKSTGLGELLAGGIPVPPGFALSTAAYEAFVEVSSLRGAIDAAMSAVSPADLGSVRGAGAAIGEAMRSAPVPDAVRAEVAGAYESLAEITGVRSPPVAVRSSAIGEDGEDATFAGQQASYLWVRGSERICDTVRDCWISLYTPEAIGYRARLAGGRERHPAMGVAVQTMVDAGVSGVMFTCNPLAVGVRHVLDVLVVGPGLRPSPRRRRQNPRSPP
jgi:pyruvate,water dikinase